MLSDKALGLIAERVALAIRTDASPGGAWLVDGGRTWHIERMTTEVRAIVIGVVSDDDKHVSVSLTIDAVYAG